MANDVSIRDNNPFSTGYVVNYNEGDQSLERFKLVYTPSVNDQLHPTKMMDNLSDLSYDYYGDSKWWWVIGDVNDSIMDPFELLPNGNLIIPDLDKIKANLNS